MRVALGQINTTVGDLAGNTARMVDFTRRAAEKGAELIVFPELSITGYPPRDLVEKPSFLADSEAALDKLAAQTASLPISLIAGFVARSDAPTGNGAMNCAALIDKGQILFPADQNSSAELRCV